jgi:hypothetical protein
LLRLDIDTSDFSALLGLCAQYERRDGTGRGNMSSYGDDGWPALSPIQGAQPEPLAPVLLAVAPPVRQSRLTILGRLLLCIPHYIVLFAIGIAATIVLVIGWFGALFMGRLPYFAADFLSGYLQWQTRVMAYTMLLTGKYPPFAYDDEDYPVRLAVRPGRLNRLAVLFRWILLIPAGIVAEFLVSVEIPLIGFVTWLIALVMGRLPGPVHQAQAAVLRYVMRLYGYEFMLTSAYPFGLFGDKPPPAAFAEPIVADPVVADPAWTGTPEPDQPTAATTSTATSAAGVPAAWLLVLSRGAKRLLVGYLVLGVLLVGATIALDAYNGTFSGIDRLTNEEAFHAIQSDLQPTNTALNDYQSRGDACHQQLSCLSALNRSLSSDLTTFASELSTVTVSGPRATQALSALESASTRFANAFASEAAATTPQEFDSRFPALQAAQLGLGQALKNMGTALNAR